jgi:CRP-like cAMP-binding protein
MSVTELDRLLGDHPFFAGMAAAHLSLIAGCGRNVVFKEGEALFRQGEEADVFYIIRHGKVGVALHHPSKGSLTIETLGEGEVVGWSWLFPPHTWKFDATAWETVRAVALDGVCLRTKAETDKELGYELYRRFAGRMSRALEATRLQLMDVYGHE